MSAQSGTWEDSAACIGKPTSWFFPTRDGQLGPGFYDKARKVCRGCPVRGRCLDACMAIEGYGGANSRRHGMFGGLSPRERDALRQPMEVAA